MVGARPDPPVTRSAGMFNSVPFVTFTDVTADDVAALKKLSVTQRRDYLAKICMKIDHDEESFPYEIAADFHLHNYNFSVKHELNVPKTSTFLSLMRTLYVESLALGLSSTEAYELFKHLLLKHACQRPPFSTGIFDMEDVKRITDYALDTFFRHYKMYTYVYVCVRELEVKVRTPGLLAADNDYQHFECKTENEIDPREQSLLDFVFEEERTQALLAKQEEERRQAALAKLSFEDRVMGQLARLEEDVDTRIKDIDGAKCLEPPPAET